jgi:hypothetical protein
MQGTCTLLTRRVYAAQGALTTMKTPGLFSFLHLSSASLSFWLSSYYVRRLPPRVPNAYSLAEAFATPFRPARNLRQPL